MTNTSSSRTRAYASLALARSTSFKRARYDRPHGSPIRHVRRVRRVDLRALGGLRVAVQRPRVHRLFVRLPGRRQLPARLRDRLAVRADVRELRQRLQRHVHRSLHLPVRERPELQGCMRRRLQDHLPEHEHVRRHVRRGLQLHVHQRERLRAHRRRQERRDVLVDRELRRDVPGDVPRALRLDGPLQRHLPGFRCPDSMQRRLGVRASLLARPRLPEVTRRGSTSTHCPQVCPRRPTLSHGARPDACVVPTSSRRPQRQG